MISSFLKSEVALSRSLMLTHATAEQCRTTAQPSSPQRARKSDPDTSKQAAANASAFAGSHCDRILAALGRLGSATPPEIGAECGLSVVQIDRRLYELERRKQARVLKGIDDKPLKRNGYRIWAGV